MEQRAQTPAEVGAIVRARRKALGVTQAELAGLADVGARFIVELEQGKATLELGKVLRVFERLGVQLLARDRGESPR